MHQRSLIRRHSLTTLLQAGIVAAFAAAGAAHATPVTVGTPFMNLEHRGINSLGFNAGAFFRIGANSVVPNGDAGTTGLGRTVNLTTGATVTRTINFAPGPVIPNFFSRLLPYDPALLGPWTLSFSNGADTTSRGVSLPAGTAQLPFVNSVTLSGSTANPTFSWAPPPGVAINGYRVNIYDKSLVGTAGGSQVTSRDLSPGTTSYTVVDTDFTTAGHPFVVGQAYAIEMSILQTRDSSTNTSNSNLQAVSRVYADFTARTGGGPLVNLPVILPSGAFQFNMAVRAGQTFYIDPDIAVGYDYAIGAGDPNFRSVTLPAGIGDSLYDLYGFDANDAPMLLAHDMAADAVFDFGAGGVARFRVSGIEQSAGLDPLNTTAFVTGLQFVADGSFTGTQTPLLAVPEPGPAALFGLGLAVLCWRRRCGAL